MRILFKLNYKKRIFDKVKIYSFNVYDKKIIDKIFNNLQK